MAGCASGAGGWPSLLACPTLRHCLPTEGEYVAMTETQEGVMEGRVEGQGDGKEEEDQLGAEGRAGIYSLELKLRATMVGRRQCG